MIARESAARGVSSLIAVGSLALLVSCGQGDDAIVSPEKHAGAVQNASSPDDMPVVVVLAKREPDPQGRLSDLHAAHAPILAERSDSTRRSAR